MSSNSRPTPGQWSYGWDGIDGCFFVPEVPNRQTPHGIGLIREADARLISAAPCLLAALKSVVEKFYREGGALQKSAEIDQAEAIIARAEGREA
jgi:hypothetical protein